MNKKEVLIVGLGIGKMYYETIKEEFNTYTLDIDIEKKPDFNSFDELKSSNKKFDLAIITTPNFLHQKNVDELKEIVDLFLVEKPGFENYDKWKEYENVIMVKNNMYRFELINEIKNILLEKKIDKINFNWYNKNRIPFPGGWFTNKEKSFGGVEKDLMPHLLSLYCAIFNEFETELELQKFQKYNLKNINSTDYGFVNHNGVYNVSDNCDIKIMKNNLNINLHADWKNDTKDEISIELFNNGQIIKKFELGLCPESCYLEMVKDVFKNKKENKRIDKFIIETINK